MIESASRSHRLCETERIDGMGIDMHMQATTRLIFVVIVLTATAVAVAAGVTKHEPGTYKMTKFAGSGENIPLNGPVIRVFSADGNTYSHIANDNENLNHASKVGAICEKRSHKVKSASVSVAGTSHSASGTGEHSMRSHTESFSFPFTLPDISRSPVAACNFELDKRVAQGNKSRDYYLSRGFVVKYENAYEAKFTAACGGGLSKGQLMSKTISTPVWIACEGTQTGGGSKPNNPTPKPMVFKAVELPLKVTAKLEADKPGRIYAKKCPAAVRYTGTITVSRPNTEVTYQITGSDWDSPQRTKTFAKAGEHEITGWTQAYRKKEADIGQLAGAAAGKNKTADAKGTVRLHVKYDGGTTRSKAIGYEVFCDAEAPRALRVKPQD